MPTSEETGTEWLPAIGRSLGFLCLHYGEQRDKPMVEQAEFLYRLGFSRKDAAGLLGTTEKSLADMTRQRARSATAKKATRKRAKETPGAKGQ